MRKNLVEIKETPTFAAAFEKRDVAQSGSATVWGTGGRKFKSCHPDNKVRSNYLTTKWLLSFLCGFGS